LSGRAGKRQTRILARRRDGDGHTDTFGDDRSRQPARRRGPAPQEEKAGP